MSELLLKDREKKNMKISFLYSDFHTGNLGKVSNGNFIAFFSCRFMTEGYFEHYLKSTSPVVGDLDSSRL